MMDAPSPAEVQASFENFVKVLRQEFGEEDPLVKKIVKYVYH